MSDAWWEKLPIVSAGTRTLYCEDLDDAARRHIHGKGYDIVDPRSLPNDTATEQQTRILAIMQGISEGTIPANKDRIKAVELEARAHGLMVNRSMRVNATLELDNKTMGEILDFGKSRFLLRNTTVELTEAARVASTRPGEAFSLTVDAESFEETGISLTLPEGNKDKD